MRNKKWHNKRAKLGLCDDFDYEVFCFFWCTALSDDFRKEETYGFIHIP